jgi:hypothetical protein
VNKSVKKLDEGVTRRVKSGRDIRQGCSMSLIIFNLYSEYLTKEALEGSGNFKMGRKVTHTVKYA